MSFAPHGKQVVQFEGYERALVADIENRDVRIDTMISAATQGECGRLSNDFLRAA